MFRKEKDRPLLRTATAAEVDLHQTALCSPPILCPLSSGVFSDGSVDPFMNEENEAPALVQGQLGCKCTELEQNPSSQSPWCRNQKGLLVETGWSRGAYSCISDRGGLDTASDAHPGFCSVANLSILGPPLSSASEAGRPFIPKGQKTCPGLLRV